MEKITKCKHSANSARNNAKSMSKLHPKRGLFHKPKSCALSRNFSKFWTCKSITTKAKKQSAFCILMRRSLYDVRWEHFREEPQLSYNNLVLAALISQSAQLEQESRSRFSAAHFRRTFQGKLHSDIFSCVTFIMHFLYGSSHSRNFYGVHAWIFAGFSF